MSNTHQKDKSLVELQRTQVWGSSNKNGEGIPCSRTTDYGTSGPGTWDDMKSEGELVWILLLFWPVEERYFGAS